MIIRMAVLEGTVAEADQEAFDRRMATTVLESIARYPGISDVRLLRPVETEVGAPPVYMVFELRFETLQAMRAALASPIRQEVRAGLAEAMTAFQGRVYHLVMDDAVHLAGKA